MIHDAAVAPRLIQRSGMRLFKAGGKTDIQDEVAIVQSGFDYCIVGNFHMVLIFVYFV